MFKNNEPNAYYDGIKSFSAKPRGIINPPSEYKVVAGAVNDAMLSAFKRAFSGYHVLGMSVPEIGV